MSRNAGGTWSAPAGQPVVAGTVIDPTVFNNLVNDIGGEITDSLSRSGKGGMTAPLRTADGNVAAPAHSFTSEAGSGIYRIGAADLGLAITGVKTHEWTATGEVVTGTLGVSGDLSPSANVALGAAGTQIIGKSAGTLIIGTSDGNEVQINRNGSAVVVTTSTSLDVKSRPIINVADPSNAQDAATKNYVDVTAGTAAATPSLLMRRDANGRVAIATPSASGDAATKGYVDGLSDGESSISWGTNWAAVADNTWLRKQPNGIVFFQLGGLGRSAGAATTICTLPAGYRPVGASGAFQALAVDATASVIKIFQVNTDGTVVAITSITNGNQLYFQIHFPTT